MVNYYLVYFKHESLEGLVNKCASIPPFNQNDYRLEKVNFYSNFFTNQNVNSYGMYSKKGKGTPYFPLKDKEDENGLTNAREHSLCLLDNVACDNQNKIREHYACVDTNQLIVHILRRLIPRYSNNYLGT